MTAIALTIAGSDSGGGAGIQADLKTMSACGVYGATAITALTAQNTLGVTAIHDVPVDMIKAQMEAVFSDLQVDAVKIGMLSRPETIEAVAVGLEKYKPAHVVLDPVMVAESGDPLIEESAVSALVERLFPLADIITPNLHEAGRLLAVDVANSPEAMEQQAAAIVKMGAKAVLLKGGHSAAKLAEDVFQSAHETPHCYSAPFVETKNTHGTGCSLSSAIASHLALGDDQKTAIQKSKNWISEAIAASDNLNIGRGAGPVHHFYKFWNT